MLKVFNSFYGEDLELDAFSIQGRQLLSTKNQFQLSETSSNTVSLKPWFIFLTKFDDNNNTLFFYFDYGEFYPFSMLQHIFRNLLLEMKFLFVSWSFFAFFLRDLTKKTIFMAGRNPGYLTLRFHKPKIHIWMTWMKVINLTSLKLFWPPEVHQDSIFKSPSLDPSGVG